MSDFISLTPAEQFMHTLGGQAASVLRGLGLLSAWGATPEIGAPDAGFRTVFAWPSIPFVLLNSLPGFHLITHPTGDWRLGTFE